MEQASAGFAVMIDFDIIPNKRPVDADEVTTNFWPDFGDGFELNQFYRCYDGAEGWLGEGYLAVWSRREIQNFREPIMEAYPDRYHFFASDGGGTQFGFVSQNDQILFVSAPDIGSEEDIRILGNWTQFLRSVETGDYI